MRLLRCYCYHCCGRRDGFPPQLLCASYGPGCKSCHCFSCLAHREPWTMQEPKNTHMKLAISSNYTPRAQHRRCYISLPLSLHQAKRWPERARDLGCFCFALLSLAFLSLAFLSFHLVPLSLQPSRAQLQSIQPASQPAICCTQLRPNSASLCNRDSCRRGFERRSLWLICLFCVKWLTGL